ncbi:hypothetical protein P5667_12195 [Bacillus velezensis]|uniref:hypothetical protein n=1 Tax=Bacillus velezensis TaxID=492670 RepID=UPI002156574E|nr:hypothetical protein [Bacillus velezensis]MDH3086665.1 hypothetical protein [Bacillus velezensis]MEE4532799.1 hypothetical protein [Bacillus velezensis]WEY79885.1 hypothetical protein P5667_12195 [Bacillus velezensis]
MPTPFEEIYGFFLPKLTDYSFLNISDQDLADTLEPLLRSSSIKFRRCKKDLTDRDQELKQFNEDLSDEEKEILACFMVVEYLTPKIVTADLLHQTLSSKDSKLYSQANHIKEIRELRNLIKKEAEDLMVQYTYSNISMRGFRS